MTGAWAVDEWQVILSRLPVGHTHEDIDQKFSCISRVREEVMV